MIFVDTSAWYAAIVPTDPNHAAAVSWLNQNNEPLITSDYVIDETLTLLRARGHSARAITLGDGFFQGKFGSVHFLTIGEIKDAWSIFRSFADKDWSFTDCTSKAVMNNLNIQTAFAFDHHFHQFGSVIVVPK